MIGAVIPVESEDGAAGKETRSMPIDPSTHAATTAAAAAEEYIVYLALSPPPSDYYDSAGSILGVESNENLEFQTEKCGVQNSIFTSRNH